MTDKKEKARYMYMHQSCTQRHIAEELEVSERTVYNWIKGNAWDKLRQAAYSAPIAIAENLYSQLAEMQQEIAGRDPGKRYPTAQEAEVTRKLVSCIEKMNKYPSLPQNLQVLETFKRFIGPKCDREMYYKIARNAELFLESEAKNGYFPYQVGYGVDSAISPFYEEDLAEDRSPTEQIAPRSLDLTSPSPCPKLVCGERPGEVSAQPEIQSVDPAQTTDSHMLQALSGSTGEPEKTGNIPETEEAAQPSLNLSSPSGDSDSYRKGEVSAHPEIQPENPTQTTDSSTLQVLSGNTDQPEKTGNIPETEEAAQRSIDLTSPKRPNQSETFQRKKFPTRLFAPRGKN